MKNNTDFFYENNRGGKSPHEFRKRERQLLRQWAISNRAAYGRGSINAYCDKIVDRGLVQHWR